MILGDENLHPRMVQAVESEGIEIFSVRKNCRGISDEEVIALSKDSKRIILTEDKDFGEWVFAHHEKDISVILLRYNRPDLDKMIDRVLDLLKNKGEDLFGKYITMTLSKIRIKDL